MGDAQQIEEDLDLDIAAATGAEAKPSSQVLTVYVPDKDRQDGSTASSGSGCSRSPTSSPGSAAA